MNASIRKNPNAILIGSSLPRRGRPPKPGGPVPDKVRKQAQRQRDKLEREAAERNAAWDAYKSRFEKDNSVRKGRLPKERSRSNTDIEKILHALSRDSKIQESNFPSSILGSVDTVDHGHRVKAEGYGNYTNNEGWANSKGLVEAGRSRRTDLPEAQVQNALSMYQKWGAAGAKGLETVENAKKLREFAEANFNPVQRIDADSTQTYLSCKLPMDAKTRKFCGAPKSQTCLYDTELMESDPEAPENDFTEEQWKEAERHVQIFHSRELGRYLREALPAWMNRSREHQLKGKPVEGECPNKAQHEEWRLKAVERDKEALERGDKRKREELACPVCHQTIYIPPLPKYAPDYSPEKRAAEREERREQGDRKHLKADPVSKPRNLPSDLAVKVLSQQDLPDLS